MSKIYVAEYPGLASADQSDSNVVLALPPTVEYTIIVSAGSSGAAQAIQPTTQLIEVSTDTTCSFVIGTAGGACLLTNQRLNANDRVVRRVPYQRPTDARALYAVLTTAYFIFTTSNV